MLTAFSCIILPKIWAVISKYKYKLIQDVDIDIINERP